MLSRDEILKAFDRINVWSRGSERAPHKPLLVLYALGQLSRGHSNSIAFRDVAPKLTELLKEFGPTRQSYHPEYPFWRLQNDGVWVVDHADQLERRTESAQRAANFAGGDVPHRTVWPVMVVIVSANPRKLAGRTQALEFFEPQKLVTQARMRTLRVAVPPRAARRRESVFPSESPPSDI